MAILVITKIVLYSIRSFLPHRNGLSKKRAIIALGLFAIITVFSKSDFVVHAQSGSAVYYLRTDGNDNCSGITNAPDVLPGSDACAFRTMKQALTVVKAGDTISILPGIYREPIILQRSGTEGQPITIKAENGPNTVYFYASESTQDKAWKNYSEYAQSGGNLNLQAGVDTNQIKFIELDWCYTEDEQGANHVFYDRCSDLPPSTVAIPFETDLVAIVKNDGTPSREVIRLPKAKEPDWTVDTPWKYSENWWKADSGATSLDDGGASPRTTSPQFLKDTMADHMLDEDLDGQPDFPNIPPGNIKDIFAQDDFTDPRETQAPDPGQISSNYATMPKKVSLGATIIFNEGLFGHYTDNMFIKAYNPATGVVELQDPRGSTDNDEDRIQYLSKFYIEGTPKAMDCPGEWVHHDGKLFVLTGTGCGRTVTESDLQNLEIAKRFQILSLESISHLVIKDINFSFGNTNRFGNDLYEVWGEGLPKHLLVPDRLISVSTDPNKNSGAAKNLIFDAITVTYSMTAIGIEGNSEVTENNSSQISIKNSVFENIDDTALRLFNYYPAESSTSFGVFDRVVIEGNTFRNIAFRPLTSEGTGLYFYRVSNVIFRNNLIQNIGQNGVQFHQSRDNFISNNLLVEGNIFDSACQMAADCGGLKFHGGNKSYGNVLVTNNMSKNNMGWTYARWRRILTRSHPELGEDSEWKYTRLGTMAQGYYLDFASGVTFYRNWAIDNSLASIFMNFNYRDGKIHIFQNILHGSINGIWFDTRLGLRNRLRATLFGNDHTDTKIIGNIFSKNENAGIFISCSGSDEITRNTLRVRNVEIDHNIYKIYHTNPNPNPYRWFKDTDYAPVAIEYQDCSNQIHGYENVARIQEQTPWERQGRDWPEEEPLYVNEQGGSKEEFSPANNNIALVTQRDNVPPEVSILIATLEAELAVTVGDTSQIASTDNASSPSLPPQDNSQQVKDPGVSATNPPPQQDQQPDNAGTDETGPARRLLQILRRPAAKTVLPILGCIGLMTVIGGGIIIRMIKRR